MFECYENFEDFFCKRVSQLRSQKNISARDMSLSMGQAQGYINTIENKNSMPSWQGFFYLCEFLQISPHEFFDDGVENPAALKEIIDVLKTLSGRDVEVLLTNARHMQRR